MKVALITRSTLFTTRGGDTVQVEETARQLIKLGVDARILLANQDINNGDFDLLHFFNITRPATILKHILHSKLPFVVSPIWIDYSNYDKFHRQGLSGMGFRLLSPGRIEYAKTIARWIKGKDDRPPFSYLQRGQQKSIREILGRASLLLTNSEAEYNEIKRHYPQLPTHVVVYNGINEKLFTPLEGIQKEKDLVICAARIEGIKNQYHLIKALNNTSFRLILIGNAAPNQLDYYRACRRIAASNIQFIDYLPQEELVNYYRRACVHVLPSWYESCGLASLEAAVSGCRVVVTKNGFASEYLGEDAFYCDPASPNSILEAVKKAAAADTSIEFQKRILSLYTWPRAASQTLEAYKKVLEPNAT